MHTDKANNGDKERFLKSYYRRFLVVLGSGLTATCGTGAACGALDSPKYDIFIFVPVLVFPGVVFAYSTHLRSIRKKDGVGDAEWRDYLFRQPFILHGVLIAVVLLLVMFAIFKGLQHFLPNLVHTA